MSENSKSDSTVEIKKTLKFEPLTSQMVIEANDLEKGLNRALSPHIRGYRGCHLRVQKRQMPDGTMFQFPMFIISIDKSSEGINRETNSKMAYIMGSRSAFNLTTATRNVLKNLVIEENELAPRERRKVITVTLNFFKCLQQIFEDNEDYRIKFEGVDYDKQRFNKEIRRYIILTRYEAPMRAEIAKMKNYNKNDNHFNLNDYVDEWDDEEDDGPIFNTEI